LLERLSNFSVKNLSSQVNLEGIENLRRSHDRKQRCKVKMRLIVILIACLILTFSSFVYADWSATNFIESGVGNFNAMEVFMTSGSSEFVSPGFANLSQPGWAGSTQGGATSTYASAIGPTVDSITFTLLFSGDRADSFEFDFFAWSNGISNGDPVDKAHFVWNGSLLTQNANVSDPSGVVPIPPSALLLGSGLLAMGLRSFRRKKKV
jgi:hypothetical protein